MINYGGEVFWEEIYPKLLSGEYSLEKEFKTSEEAILFAIEYLGIPEIAIKQVNGKQFDINPEYARLENILLVGQKLILKNGKGSFITNAIKINQYLKRDLLDEIDKRPEDDVKDIIDELFFVKLQLFVTQDQYKRFMRGK